MKTLILCFVFSVVTLNSCTPSHEEPVQDKNSGPPVGVHDRGQKTSGFKKAKAGYPVIGTLKTRNGKITIHSSQSGPLFTVRDESGKTVLKEAPEEELRAKLPDIYEDVKEQIAQKVWAGSGPTREDPPLD